MMYGRARDPARSFTPNGRPMRKTRKIAMRLASVNSKSELSEMYVLERPSKKSWLKPGLRECLESRPPPPNLDLSGPSPCTYSITDHHWKPHPTDTPTRLPVKYSRDALPNPNTELWTYNVNHTRKTPTPCTYTHPTVLGSYCPSKKSAPAYSLRPRNLKTHNSKGTDPGPAPNTYNYADSLDSTHRHFPAITMATKSSTGKHVLTPGPAHYNPNHTHCLHRSPAYSMRIRLTESSSSAQQHM